MFDKPARRHLAFLLADGTKYYRKVVSASEQPTTETLPLDASLPVTAPKDTTMVCFLELCRQAVDDSELVWWALDVAVANLQSVEIPQEAPA
jgi:hypothetical protein